MSLRCLLDMDGVVADFTGGASYLHGVENPHHRADSPRGNIAWDTIELLSTTPAEFYAPMGYEFWRDLEKTPEADAIVDLVKQFFGGGVCFLTAPIETAGCVEGKLAWARHHYPEIPLLFSCRASAGGEPPKHFCASDRSVLLDDRQGNVDAFRVGGGLGWVVPRPWNDSWRDESELVHCLKEFLDSLLD